MRMARGDREEREKIHKVSLLRALRVRRANLSVSLVLLDGFDAFALSVPLCEREERAQAVRFHFLRRCVNSSRAMKPQKVRLFVKPFCGWCHEAKDWLDERGIAYDELDVIADRAAFREMVALSGQTLAPVIEVDGEVLADFDTGQLEKFWKKLEAGGHGS
jgi:glutaredoxin 3